jgi:hypothetical protein
MSCEGFQETSKIGSGQVDSETAGTRRDQEETSGRVHRAVEVLASGVALLHGGESVDAEVIHEPVNEAAESFC